MINFIKVVTLIIAVSNGSFVLGNIGTGDKDLSDSNSIFDGMEEASSKMGRRIKDDEIESNHGGGHVEFGGGHHGGRYSCSKTCTVWDTYCFRFGRRGRGTSGQSQEQEQARMSEGETESHDGGEQHEGGYGGGSGYGGGNHGGGCMKQCHAKCMNWKTVCSKVRRPNPYHKRGYEETAPVPVEQEQVMNMDEVKPRESGQSPTNYYSEDGNM